ncbi:MAG: 6-carboxytetrahydropterin synthase [Candidatus Rokubacteria bacterium]|nr:6-carboxytetrahydropterin synthase [Candidatus Rokubacteria bacterium]MBI3824579.1 6-carboxytetrahydropterin synthase [Candidatus Rokubacteria bacterium]
MSAPLMAGMSAPLTVLAAPRLELTRVYHFSAAHRLVSPRLDAEANARLYGHCARPHGHNYYLEVTVAGCPDPLTGMSVDLGRLDAIVAGAVIDRVDHYALEEVPALAGVVTTGESLARAFWGLIRNAGPEVALVQVTVVETAKNRFEYRGGE